MTTDLSPELFALLRAAVDKAGLDVSDVDIRSDHYRVTWYTWLAQQAYALGAISRALDEPAAGPELPAITLPWAGYGCRVVVDEDGNITLGIDDFADILDCGANEATEVAAALLTAARISRDITGERPVITLHASALAADRGPWRWELHIAGRLGSWAHHRHSTLAAADTADGLARLIADQHLEDRPAELRHTPWRVLVWRASETTLTLATVAALRTGGGDGLPRVNSTPADPERHPYTGPAGLGGA